MSVGMGTARVPGRQGHFCRLREKGKNQTQVVRTDSPLPLKIAPPGYCRGTPWRALTNMTRGFPSARAGRRPMESPSPRRVPVSGAPYEVGRPSDKLSSRCEGNEGEMMENSGNKARMSMKTKGRSEEPTDSGVSEGCLAAAYFPEIEQGQPTCGSTAAASLPHFKTRGTKPECL